VINALNTSSMDNPTNLELTSLNPTVSILLIKVDVLLLFFKTDLNNRSDQSSQLIDNKE